MTHLDQSIGADVREKVARRRQREEARVRRIAAERADAKRAVLECERRLVLAALAGGLSQQDVATIAGVTRAALQGWARRKADRDE